MPQQIVDLDASGVTGRTVGARISGTVYTLPADIPATLYVKLLDAAERGESTAHEAVELHDEMLAMFRVHQPELERLPLGLTEMTAAIGFLYSGPAAEAADDVPPPKAPRRRPSSTAAKKSSGSRSST